MTAHHYCTCSSKWQLPFKRQLTQTRLPNCTPLRLRRLHLPSTAAPAPRMATSPNRITYLSCRSPRTLLTTLKRHHISLASTTSVTIVWSRQIMHFRHRIPNLHLRLLMTRPLRSESQLISSSKLCPCATEVTRRISLLATWTSLRDWRLCRPCLWYNNIRPRRSEERQLYRKLGLDSIRRRGLVLNWATSEIRTGPMKKFRTWPTWSRSPSPKSTSGTGSAKRRIENSTRCMNLLHSTQRLALTDTRSRMTRLTRKK